MKRTQIESYDEPCVFCKDKETFHFRMVSDIHQIGIECCYECFKKYNHVFDNEFMVEADKKELIAYLKENPEIPTHIT